MLDGGTDVDERPKPNLATPRTRRDLVRRRVTDGSHHGQGSRLLDPRCRSGTGDYLILQETPQLDAHVKPDLIRTYANAPSPPTANRGRSATHRGVAGALLLRYLTTERYVRPLPTKSGAPWAVAKNASGSVLFPSYRRVSAGGVYSQPLPSLVNQ